MSSEKRQVRRSALKEPPFLRYFPASWFSSLGSWMVRFLLGWSAWEITHSASWVGGDGCPDAGPRSSCSHRCLALFRTVSILATGSLLLCLCTHSLPLAGGVAMLMDPLWPERADELGLGARGGDVLAHAHASCVDPSSLWAATPCQVP